MMALPVPAERRALFDPSFVRFHDAPATVSVVETDPGGATQIDFLVAGPSILLKGKAGTSLYWLKSKRCADGAIMIVCGNDLHLHLIELKRTITAGKWGEVKDQFAGMLVNVRAMLGTIGLREPARITCHVAYEHDRFDASPVLSKVINFTNGPQILAGAEWAGGAVAILDRAGISVNKIVWGSPATAIGCP